jgi:nucleotide-binding universal stress UspA family protein
MYRSLLVPLDGSATAEQALPLALNIARRASAALELVSVQVPFPAVYGEDMARRRPKPSRRLAPTSTGSPDASPPIHPFRRRPRCLRDQSPTASPSMQPAKART